MIKFFLLLCISAMLLAGCAAQTSRWRDDAFSRFSSALAAGSQQLAPEETDNIRQTLALADRYFTKHLSDDADRLYQLSCQKSQLLYRTIVLSKVRQGAMLAVQNETTKQHEEIALATDAVSIRDVLNRAEQEQSSPDSALSGVMCDETARIEMVPDVPVSGPPAPAETKAATTASFPGPAGNRCKKAADGANEPGMASPNVERRGNATAKRVASAPQAKAVGAASSISGPVSTITGSRSGAKRGDPSRTTIYLTFDDGPSRLTLPIAEYLKSQGIAATFFALGSNVKGHEKVVRETVALGHRVGNHTLSHNLRKLNGSLHRSVNEIALTSDMIEKLGGDGKMVRIPYGASSRMLASTVASEGGQIFDWDINSLDSSRRGAKDSLFIERAVIQQLQKSGKRHIVMLFHDGAGHEATLTAIRNLVPRLKQEGYRFGLLSRSERVAQSGTGRNSTP